MAINPLAPSPNFRDTVSENIEDPVSYELMTKAVTLVPCGHILNEDTAIQCLARNKLCPLGKELIEKYIPNYTIRTLAEAAIAHPQEEGPSEETQQLFQQAKVLTEQNNHEAAISLLLEALQLSPGYEKAQAPSPFPQPPKISPKLFPAPIANPNLIQPLPKEVVMPKIAFGKAKWAQYFGDIGVEPPLPLNFDEILNAPCPFWPRKRVQETHLLTLIPATVNGKPFTLNSLGELIQKPQEGGKATQYEDYWDTIQKEYGNTAPAASYWALMTKDVIPESRRKTYDAQNQLLATYNQKSLLPYEIPHLLESAAGIFMVYVQSGTRLYSDSPCTYTRCQERISSDPDYPLVVGGFATGGLCVDYYDDVVVEFNGVGGCRKF